MAPAEKDLITVYKKVQKENSVEKNALKRITNLYAFTIPVNTFFNNVMIMTEDLSVRENRLLLLKRIKDLFVDEADFQKIVIKGN